MSKRNRKHRHKSYQGEDAKTPSQGPTVTRYKAVIRSPLGEWWHDHKRNAKIIGGITGGVAIAAWLLFELFRLVF